jgi:hypothetical protein
MCYLGHKRMVGMCSRGHAEVWQHVRQVILLDKSPEALGMPLRSRLDLGSLYRSDSRPLIVTKAGLEPGVTVNTKIWLPNA